MNLDPYGVGRGAVDLSSMIMIALLWVLGNFSIAR